MEKVDFTALAWLALIALVATGALLRVRPHERFTFLNTLWLFFLAIAGQAAAVALLALDLPRASGTVHTIFRILTAVALIRLFGFVVFRLLLPLAGKRPTRIVEDLAIALAYVGYGLVQLRGAGVDLGSLVTTSAILTAVIAFSMQDTLGNVLGGLAIQLDNSVQVGDWIRIDSDLTGRVRDIRWRTTLIETRNWETVLIPNSTLMKGRVSILGRGEGSAPAWRRWITFIVDPGVPPARVIAMVEDEMREFAIPNVARTPAPSCILHGFEHGNLRYSLRYFLTDFLEDDTTDSMVRVHLFASLQRAGIRMAEPQQTVHAVQRDEAHAQSVKQRELTRRLQVLNSVQLFAGLSEAEKAEIAERLQYAPFARGDVVTKQGNAAHWLYILAFGDAEVLYEPPGGTAQLIGSVQAGQFFGEMALINGEARSATVMAKTDVECYRLDRASFQELLRQRPEIAAEVRRVIGARKPDLEQARDAFARVPETVDEKKVRLLTRIRRFFFGQPA
jgi:small-conductance mechanosensitive channel/CRP-like cAMP-binding protein